MEKVGKKKKAMTVFNISCFPLGNSVTAGMGPRFFYPPPSPLPTETLSNCGD